MLLKIFGVVLMALMMLGTAQAEPNEPESWGFNPWYIGSTTEPMEGFVLSPENEQILSRDDGRTCKMQVYFAQVEMVAGENAPEMKLDVFLGYVDGQLVLVKALNRKAEQDLFDSLVAYWDATYHQGSVVPTHIYADYRDRTKNGASHSLWELHCPDRKLAAETEFIIYDDGPVMVFSLMGDILFDHYYGSYYQTDSF